VPRRNIKSFTLILMAALSFAWQGEGNSAAVVTVDLFDLVYISGGRVILGQIAELTGDIRSVERLKTLQIGTVMKRRESRIITPEDIRRVLPNDIEVAFTGAPAWKWFRRLQPINFAKSRPLSNGALLCWGRLYYSIHLSGRSAAEPAGDLLTPVQYSIISTGVLAGGRQIVSLERCDSSGQVRRLHLPVEIQLFARLAFALKHIPRGRP